MSDGMKYCPSCNTDKPLFDFVRDAQRESGFRNLCKSCKNRQARGGRERVKEVKQEVKKVVLNLTQKKYWGTDGWQRREREPNEAPGQLINKMAGKYVPDKAAFYRNDGNKHIKSRGDRC